MSAGTQQRTATATQTTARPMLSPEEKDAQLLNQIIADAARVQAIADRVSPEKMAHVGSIEKAFRLADAVQKLRESVTPAMMKSIMALMGTSLGFKTDKDNPKQGQAPQPYHENIVRDCWIAATLKGARTSGNEFNIIAGREYLTKEFYLRACREVEGVTSFDVIGGTPKVVEGKTLCRMAVNWTMNGVPNCLKDQEGKPGRTFVIKVNDYMGDDGVIGKATRKACKAAYELMTGVQMQDPEDFPDTVKDRPKKLDDLTAKLNGKPNDGLPDDRRRVTESEQQATSEAAGETVSQQEADDLELNLNLDQSIEGLVAQLEWSAAQASTKIAKYLFETWKQARLDQATIEQKRGVVEYLQGCLERA